MLNADFPATIDSCVLAHQAVCDLLLRLAETPRLYLPKWTSKIIEEVNKTHLEKLEWPQHLTRKWAAAVEKSFPEAFVPGYEAFLPLATNDKKDRHVLAAAICSKSEVIVTFNLKHFQEAALKPFGIRALHPSEFLLTLYTINPGLVIARLGEMAARRRKTLEQMVSSLKLSVPAFALQVTEDLKLQLPD